MLSNQIKIIVSILLGNSVIILSLNFLSYKQNNEGQNFRRKFDTSIIEERSVIEVAVNSYVVGAIQKQLYIGNVNDGFALLQIDMESLEIKSIPLKIDDVTLLNPFIRIDSPYFYVHEGRKSLLFVGVVDKWVAKKVLHQPIPFIDAMMISPTSFVLRAINNKDENAIVKLTNSYPQFQEAENLLVKQKEGLYSTAGALHYARPLNKVVYLYYFRNEYVMLDTVLNVYKTGKTIDTTSIAKINPVQLTENVYTLASPRQLVNKCSFIFDHYLFVCSTVMGDHEERKIFENSSTIDVYNLFNLTYLGSIRLPDYSNEKLKSFAVYGETLVGVYDHRIVIFNFNVEYFKAVFTDKTGLSPGLDEDILLAGKIPASLVEVQEPF